MKTSLICGAALAILGLAAAPLLAQTQTTTSSSSTGYVQTSKIIGTKVKTAKGEEIGVVKDVVLDRSNGCMAYTVLAAGGTGTRVTGQSKLVAVPWSVYSISPDASYLTIQVERDRIYNGPVFEYSRIGDPAFTSTVYSTYGVSAGVGISSATRTTGTATTTGGMSNPPPPAEGPAGNAAPQVTASSATSASPAPTAAATVSAAATASVSPSKASRTKVGASPSGRHHKDGTESTQGISTEKATGATNEESAEASGSPSSKTSSHRKNKKPATEAVPTPGGEQE
jgi:sporulation protein YlmC with PRC-barrel domain